MTPKELRRRTEAFAVKVLEFSRPLLARLETRDCALQVRRSATSVAQNYGSCGIAKSHADFVSKMRTTLEEADETARWLRILRDANLTADPNLEELIAESRELTAIFAASCATATRNARERR